ncbi:hypothetical protein EYF80_027903 [Liparis tanakae]|uniref:Uncharacterized protein n=1 Tax=Liparis tanakae TaxID=230148 RepID=A0A4Z2H7K2_9TELE|nr:hypothetical protein EYF80_027903 [Liparis tanakae]
MTGGATQELNNRLKVEIFQLASTIAPLKTRHSKHRRQSVARKNAFGVNALLDLIRSHPLKGLSSLKLHPHQPLDKSPDGMRPEDRGTVVIQELAIVSKRGANVINVLLFFEADGCHRGLTGAAASVGSHGK